jgi:predicted PurR-regulated permease PerM
MLLWPLRQQASVRAVLMAGALLLGVWLLRVLGGVLAPFILVYIVAYLLHPLVTMAQRRWRVPRWLPALGITMVFVGALGLVVFLLVPALVGQIETLARRVVELATRVPDLIARADFLDAAERSGLIRRQELVRELQQFLPQQVESLVGRLPAALAGLTRSVGAIIGLVTTVVLVPVLLFYMLIDFATIRDALVRMLPRYRGSRSYMARVGDVVGSYLRGQLTISLIAAVLVTIPLVILGVPFALVIGLLTGLLNMIPTIGAVLSYVIGGLLMLAFGTWADVAIVIAVIAGESLLEQSVLTPRIMGAQVGLHPVLVMLSLFVFGALIGPIGLFIAVPATALLVGLYRAFQGQLTIELAKEDPGPAG